MDALSWAFSLAGLGITLVLVLAACWISHRYTGNPTMSTTISMAALVVAVASYGAQYTGVQLQRAQFELAQAEMRGLLMFEAEHDQEWNVKLQKADGKPFRVQNLNLIPTYQFSHHQGPIHGQPVEIQPEYRTGGEVAEVANARERICLVDDAACSENARLIMVTLDFVHDQRRYRIVANPNSDD